MQVTHLPSRSPKGKTGTAILECLLYVLEAAAHSLSDQHGTKLPTALILCCFGWFLLSQTSVGAIPSQKDQVKSMAPEPMLVSQNQSQGAKTIQRVARGSTLKQHKNNWSKILTVESNRWVYVLYTILSMILYVCFPKLKTK